MNTVDSYIPRSSVSRAIAGSRLLVGLLQGLALFLIYQAAENKLWTTGNSGLFAALLLACTIVPVLLVSALGYFPYRTLWRWLLPAATVLALLGFYDIWRSIGAPYWGDYGKIDDGARFPSPELWVHAVAGFFIAHALVSASVLEGRYIASYRNIFESASKLLIQVAFAGVFTGIVWLVLLLGAAMFDMIKLSFLKDVLDESWFAIPVTTFAFAYALHITDVRPAIVHGVRSLVLVLLSWILPVAVLLIGGFLLALPFTGLEPLWATKAATALLLAAAAVLVVLINAAFQDGSVTEEVALPIWAGARIAAFLILPLALIAAYALSLRVGQYGWTVDRLVAAFCLVVALCCGAGYFWAALRSPQWLSRIAPVNVLTAFILLLLLLAIFSPVLDPARISVNSQLAQLNAGKIEASKFDYEYLRFEGKRFGNEALRAMASAKSGKDSAVIALKAQAALQQNALWNAEPQKVDAKLLAVNIAVRTPDAALPESFLAQNWKEAIKDKAWQYPECLHNSGKTCEALILDMDTDGTVEVLLREQGGSLQVFHLAKDTWILAGTVDLPGNCASVNDALSLGRISTAPTKMEDVVIAGRHYRLVNKAPLTCPPAVAGKP
jgi:hypothetical protein